MGSVSSKGRLLSTMARGPKRHMKRLNAPKHWMLDKMGGTWAPRPSTGPHKLRECLPLVLILRNRLKYALTKKEVQQICMMGLVKVDGRRRTDPNFPCGFNDVISLDKTDEHFLCFSTLRDASCSTVLTTTSSLTRTPSSFAVSTGSLSVPRASLPSPPTMAAPSATRILLCV